MEKVWSWQSACVARRLKNQLKMVYSFAMDAEKLLKHMAWANQKIFSHVAALPDQALDSYSVNPQWTAREIVRHITSSATWYGYRLLDQRALSDAEKSAWQVKLDATEIPPTSMKDMAIILDRASQADAVLLEAARLADSSMVHETPSGSVTRARSTIVSQAIHHATEHRAQLISALEAKGFTTINLDDFDLWAFSSTIGE